MTEKQQFVYVLKLIPRLLKEDQWKESDQEIVEEHFHTLKKMQQDGQLILAGRTLQMDETTFGLVIFEANSMTDAKMMMKNDPAVKKGIMTAEIFPYRVALMRN
ncbi:YciI family protein [Bacillus sp. 2205SS5-2]|uniref:YciI family protein n=1 Tax=Bacillus sp. 2205SS5-2 TaxID=3109031 RepID=UPI0030060323